MSPTIHCIRHGQGFHNVGAGFYDLPDPQMTPLGIEQCVGLREQQFREQSHISLIAASPLSRTIQSAFVIFQSSLESETPPNTILALPDAQETSDSPCDIGSDLAVLSTICGENHWPVNLSLIKNDWNVKTNTGRYSPSATAISSRARDTRIFLRTQARNFAAAGDPDAHIVLVTHGGFLHFFTGDWEYAEKFPGTGWVNCETRAYTFEHGIDNDEDLDARLIETTDSRLARGLNHPMPSNEQQTELFNEAMQAWEDQGLQNHAKV